MASYPMSPDWPGTAFGQITSHPRFLRSRRSDTPQSGRAHTPHGERWTPRIRARSSDHQDHRHSPSLRLEISPEFARFPRSARGAAKCHRKCNRREAGKPSSRLESDGSADWANARHVIRSPTGAFRYLIRFVGLHDEGNVAGIGTMGVGEPQFCSVTSVKLLGGY